LDMQGCILKEGRVSSRKEKNKAQQGKKTKLDSTSKIQALAKENKC